MDFVLRASLERSPTALLASIFSPLRSAFIEADPLGRLRDILERFKETCSCSKRRRRYLKIKPGAAPGIQIAMQTSAESAIQLALIQLVCRK